MKYLIKDIIGDKCLTEEIPLIMFGIRKTLIWIGYKTTYADLKQFRNEIYEMIHQNNMSCQEIKKHFKLYQKDFGSFIRRCLYIKTKTQSEALNNYFIKNNIYITNDKNIYLQQCQFNFDPYAYPQIPGYELLISNGIYHPVNNKNGVCRDHIISKEYGWRNNINPQIISNIHNCQFLLNKTNIEKSSQSWLTLEELEKKIDDNNFTFCPNPVNNLPKSEAHKLKLSELNKLYMFATNGIENIRILKTQQLPDGFRRGITRKN